MINASQALIAASVTQPEIKIIIKKENDNISFNIIDNGPGVESDVAKRIFEPFFTTKDDGTGLGLAICKGLVSKLKGVLTLENPGIHGAHFALVVPSGEVA